MNCQRKKIQQQETKTTTTNKCALKSTASHITLCSPKMAQSQEVSLVGIHSQEDGSTVHEDSAAYRVTTSSLTMEVGVSWSVQYLALQTDTRITRAIILTDSMNLPRKAESGTDCLDWYTARHSLWLQRVLWVYCSDHAGVRGNELRDKPVSSADIASSRSTA